MSTPAMITLGTPEIPSAVELGATVVYIGCGHEVRCADAPRACSVSLWGVMELMGEMKTPRRLIARPDDLDDPRDWPVFEPHELSTPEAVAAFAARSLDEESVA